MLCYNKFMKEYTLKFDTLSIKTQENIKNDRLLGVVNPYAFKDENAVRRTDNPHDKPTLLRSNFIRDVDKILNCPYYNRYNDKTQVFSLYKNDDITRRGLHVQLVSRIARTIGKALNLNLELIEAIALGHDLGHTPFGHAGEKILDEIYFKNTNRHFAHNLQSVRVLDKIFNYNLTLETLDGILGHNGEIELPTYYPSNKRDFYEFDKTLEESYTCPNKLKSLSPSTLEGCVVRIADIIAYLGKDRQDGTKTKIYDENDYDSTIIGTINAEIINNISVNIIENSYGKNYIKLSNEYFNALSKLKAENYKNIYNNQKTFTEQEKLIKLMMQKLYEKLKNDLINKNLSSPVFVHHVDYISKTYYKRKTPYLDENADQIIVDFIASMTDDYFIELYKTVFNEQVKLNYKGYF